MAENKLTIGVKLGYGVCDLGGNLFFTVVSFWLLNYLTDTVGIAAGVAGIVVLIGKLWDAVTDPVVGHLSDRTQSRWGQRRPYMLFGAVPLFVTMVIMFTNPQLDNPTLLFLWAVLAFCLLNTAYTVVNIPYSSLTPNLTQDYHERSSLNGYRFAFAVVGTLLGAGAALPIVQAFPTRSAGFTVLGTLFGAVMMVTALVTVFSVREKGGATRPAGLSSGFLKSYGHVVRNKPFRVLLVVFALHITAVTVVSGILVYYFKYIYNNEPMTTVGLLLLLGTAVLFIPVSVLAARRFGKKPVYWAGLSIVALACLLVFFVGHILGMTAMFVLMVLAGIGFGGIYSTPWAMVPDTVEYDFLETGERREGAYYGVWTFMTKIGQALAVGISGLMLELTGYVPEVSQEPLALLGIRLVAGPIPAAIFVLAALALIRYPLDEESYNQIMEAIRKREAPDSGGSADAPA
jgi:GPH family glycoside/pentoside/hexuronide:cation symporter